MTSASDDKWRTFNCFFQSGRANDLSAPLYVILTNKMHFLNFNSILLVFYMFRIFYVHLQEDYIVHAGLYGVFFMHLCKQYGLNGMV